MDPTLFPNSGSGTIISQKVKEHIDQTVNSGLFVLLDSSIEQSWARDNFLASQQRQRDNVIVRMSGRVFVV